MSRYTPQELEALRHAKAELGQKIRDAEAELKRSSRQPVRLGQTKSNEQALLISPANRQGAPTRITKEVAQVLISSEWSDVLERFANGEELDPNLFTATEDDEDSDSTEESE